MKIKKENLNLVIEMLESNKYGSCQKIADELSKNGLEISRRTVSDINIGAAYRQERDYPINFRYTKGKRTICCVCGEKTKAFFKGEQYCSRHYMQMYNNGKILERTIYDRNVVIEENGSFRIVLTDAKGNKTGETIIDISSYPLVEKYKWYMSNHNGKNYCQGTIEEGKKVSLHRFLTSCPSDKVVDHINGDSLDNRIENLRIVSQKENMRNIRPNDIKGVESYLLKSGEERWRARITVDYKTISLGTFNTFESALKARLEAEKKYWN